MSDVRFGRKAKDRIRRYGRANSRAGAPSADGGSKDKCMVEKEMSSVKVEWFMRFKIEGETMTGTKL